MGPCTSRPHGKGDLRGREREEEAGIRYPGCECASVLACLRVCVVQEGQGLGSERTESSDSIRPQFSWAGVEGKGVGPAEL